MSNQANQPKESELRPLVNINIDFKGLEKVAPHLEKIIDNIVKAVSRGVGTFYSPLGRVREAKADAKIDAIQAQMSTNQEKHRFDLEQLRLNHVASSNQSTLEQRATAYLLEDAVRKQTNREKIAMVFMADLGHNIPNKDADREIEDSWLTQFWNYAENVDSEDVREFYARLLSGEVARPGSISPLTLRTLSALSREAAEHFQRLSSLSIDDGTNVFVIHPHVFAFQNIGPLDEYGVSYDNLFEIEAFGLIRSAETIMLNFGGDNTAEPAPVNYAGEAALLNLAGKQIQQLRFTRAGREIRRVLSLKPITAYTSTLKKAMGDAIELLGESRIL